MTRPADASFAEPAAESRCGGEDDHMQTGATVARWRRYGKDRLYVTGVDGTRIGYRDLLTGEDHIEEPDLRDDFLAALVAWSAPEQQPSPSEVPDASQGADDWYDLRDHRPGALARKQALALKEAAPVKTFLARALGVHTDERAWRVGADGEEMVATQLRRLTKRDARWRFLNAIPVGEKGSDIDHLVVGPGGVFTLNAKHHPRARVWVRGDTFMVNGQRLPYIRNSRHEAMRASQLLTAASGFPVQVGGVVVPVGSDNLSVKDAPPDVAIVNRMRLRRWLCHRPPVLAEEQVAAIFDAARRSTTWRSNTSRSSLSE